MNQILCIVDHNGLEANAVILLEQQHALIDPVQTIGFRGGARMWTLGYVHIAKPGCELCCRLNRRLVVWIHAQEEIVVPIADGGEVMPHHVAYDTGFVPARYKDGRAAFKRNWQLAS